MGNVNLLRADFCNASTPVHSSGCRPQQPLSIMLQREVILCGTHAMFKTERRSED